MMSFIKGWPLWSAYSALSLAIALLIGGLTYVWLRRLERRKKRLLRGREIEGPIEPDNSPIHNSEATVRSRGVRSIESRFRLIRRFLIPLFVLVWVLIAVAPALGRVSGVYVSLLAGAITVVVGMAAKPWIENFIAGLVISIGQSIRVGDTIEIDGQYGNVEEITLTYCVVKVWDWRRYVIPNQKMIQKEFINLTLKDSFVWTKVEFWVGPSANLEEVERLAVEAMVSSGALKEDEAPSFWVMGLEKEAIRCWVAGWAETPAEAWNLGHDARKAIAQKLNGEGIPFHHKYHSVNSHKIA